MPLRHPPARAAARSAPAGRPLLCLLLALEAAALCLLFSARPAAAAEAPFTVITVNNKAYNVSYARTSWNVSAAELQSQPWWGSLQEAQAATLQSAALGVADSFLNTTYGPSFCWQFLEYNNGMLGSWRLILGTAAAERVNSGPAERYDNLSVVSTPPLAVYTDAPSAVIEVLDGSLMPLQLSMTNMTCGAPPCTAKWQVFLGMNNAPIATVEGSSINITAGRTLSALIDTRYRNLPYNLTLRAVYTNQDYVAAYELVSLTIVTPPPPSLGGVSASPEAVEGPGAVSLTAGNITCPTASCASTWRVVCRLENQTSVADFTKSGTNTSVSTGFETSGDGIDIKLFGPDNYTCSATLLVLDTASGKNTTGEASFMVSVPAPTFDVPVASPATVEGPGTVNLTASNTTCPSSSCDSSWQVTCRVAGGGVGIAPPFPMKVGGSAGQSASDFNITKAGPDAPVAIGYFAGGFDLQLSALDNYTCSASLTLTDTVTGKSATNGVTFEVVSPPAPTAGPTVASPDTLEGPGTVAFTASAITCPRGPCNSTWQVSCQQAEGGGGVQTPFPFRIGSVAGQSARLINHTKAGADARLSIGVGASFDMDLASLANYSCTAELTVTDTATGLSATNQSTFALITLPPTAEITPGQPVNITAGDSAALDASGSSCPGTPGNCTFTWLLECDDTEPVPATGDTFTVTTGAGAGRTVNTARSTGVRCVAGLTVTDGYGLSDTTNTIIQVLPAPPVCDNTTATPSTLPSYSERIVCQPVKALRKSRINPRRRARVLRKAVTVSFALVDPQGFKAEVAFDSVTSNRAEPDCGRNREGVCVPEASSLGDGDLQILPQLRAPARRKDLGGRTLRVAYTATVPETGLSCSGSIDLCAPASKRSPACAAFDSTGQARPVHNCPQLG